MEKKYLKISGGQDSWRFSQTLGADRQTRPNQGVLDKLTGEQGPFLHHSIPGIQLISILAENPAATYIAFTGSSS